MGNRTVTEQLRRAIERSGQSFRDIAKETGVNVGVVSRFVRKERGINGDTVDKLCRWLGLELQTKAKANNGSTI